MTIHEIQKNYTEHHTSRARRYVSRKNKEGIAEQYKGIFGEGYKVFTPAWDSTQYCFVTYFVK